jgi:hypothetical protein
MQNGHAEEESVTSSPFTTVIRDRLILVERAACAIERGAGDADIFDLRLQLIDLLGLIHRNPSIEAASQDLYDAAAAYAAHGLESASAVRQLGLLREARLRLRARLTEARTS